MRLVLKIPRAFPWEVTPGNEVKVSRPVDGLHGRPPPPDGWQAKRVADSPQSGWLHRKCILGHGRGRAPAAAGRAAEFQILQRPITALPLSRRGMQRWVGRGIIADNLITSAALPLRAQSVTANLARSYCRTYRPDQMAVSGPTARQLSAIAEAVLRWKVATY